MGISLPQPLMLRLYTGYCFDHIMSEYIAFLKEKNAKILGIELFFNYKRLKIVSEYDQEIPQSQTADNPMAWRGRATQTS